MTAEEKTILARFLDLADDFIRDGHARKRETVVYSDDGPENAPGDNLAPPGKPLPLAYLVDEPDDSRNPEDSCNPEDYIEKICGEIRACRACGLGAARMNAAPGEGVMHPLVMVIGEAPGAEEDAAGRPFVGNAGKLLDKMLASIGLSRETNCYIGNTVKCRPPGNRNPEPGEMSACFPFLARQISLLRPLAILCAGRIAAQDILKTSEGISALRGKFHHISMPQVPESGKPATGAAPDIPVLCTYHPSAVLRDRSLRQPVWDDLNLLKSKLAMLDSGNG